MRQTTIVKHLEVDKKWYLIDAEGQVLGRVAAQVATILRGKNKPTFTPNVDMGDNVVIINAEKIVLTANKETKKMYHRHSGYKGGLTSQTAAVVREKKPYALLELAIKGMLPKTALGRKQFKNLFVYVGPEHKQAAQQPVKIEVK
ncbi:50S ribosomal protein L13 [Mycoplasmopsis agassizii]|uniref:Large ribosomal subunit protein uL13 n=1 Tax=Mycoplasmopsis agassizii TaxID=33922 RepID=A0A269THZ0_9BACT|nr:50S ribosomal protein L13 [Mycoplasmopsis agassizii]PAK21007.1 50S ribosomal protein L13 [Mycoplasmopsis agassizii]